MALSDDIKTSLLILNNANVISDQTFKKLLEVACQDLVTSKTNDIKALYGSKADVIKEVHSAILKTLLFLAQNNTSKDKVQFLLSKDCKIDAARAKVLSEAYEKHKPQLLMKLGNVGTYLPHIVDIDWEIDYLIKSSALDSYEGPRYRVKMITEKFDVTSQSNILEDVVFWCNMQEMQDLVYKLDDAVRHCQKIAHPSLHI